MKFFLKCGFEEFYLSIQVDEKGVTNERVKVKGAADDEMLLEMTEDGEVGKSRKSSRICKVQRSYNIVEYESF